MDDIPVMLHFFFIKHTFLRLDTSPFDAKAVSIQPGICHQTDVFFEAVVVVHGIQRGLGKAGGFHMLQCPVIAAYIVAFNLMGSCCCADEEIGGKFHVLDLLLVWMDV